MLNNKYLTKDVDKRNLKKFIYRSSKTPKIGKILSSELRKVKAKIRIEEKFNGFNISIMSNEPLWDDPSWKPQTTTNQYNWYWWGELSESLYRFGCVGGYVDKTTGKLIKRRLKPSFKKYLEDNSFVVTFRENGRGCIYTVMIPNVGIWVGGSIDLSWIMCISSTPREITARLSRDGSRWTWIETDLKIQKTIRRLKA